LDRVILHTVMHHSSTSTYIYHNFVEIEGTVCGRTDRHLRPTLLCRLGGLYLTRGSQHSQEWHDPHRQFVCRWPTTNNSYALKK